jgi:thiol-disulfide isomerase/thioredoxin
VWIKGTPVNEYKPGNIYVVEFWSPRVAACRRSGPLLSELAALYKDQSVTIISVATVEQEGPGVVDAYVKQMGEKLTHTIGYDTTGDSTRRYMQPSGQSGIPVAFVVNDRGQIAWIGHPMDNLDRVLAKIADGSWDLIKANDEARRKVAAEEKGAPLVMRLEEEFGAGQPEKALATMDQLFAVDPPVMGEWAMTKFAFLLMQKKDADAAYKYAAAMLEGGLKDDAETLKSIAWMTLAEPGVVRRDIPLARQIAQRADDLTKHADASILDTLAKAQFESGDIKGAAETQKLAVEATTLPSQKKELEQRLRQYVGAKKAETPVKKP